LAFHNLHPLSSRMQTQLSHYNLFTQCLDGASRLAVIGDA